MKTFINTRFDRWLKKRIPSNDTHSLSNRTIFILPSKFGFAYLFFVILVFLLGTNYQNNTIILLSYLLASLFLTVMLHSFYNFSQIVLSSQAKQSLFANQQANFPMMIKVAKVHYDIHLQFVSQSISEKLHINQCVRGENHVLVPHKAMQRGVYEIGRVKVYSEYPLGLFITWAMLDFSHQLVVFPQAKKMPSNHDYLTGLDEQNTNKNCAIRPLSGNEDFVELKPYILGESPAKIAWKQLARGQGKLSKHYQNEQGNLLWLKLSDMPSVNIETKLSYLCDLILALGKNNRDFGLLLAASTSIKGDHVVKISPSSGQQHQQKCLVALAEFQHNNRH